MAIPTMLPLKRGEVHINMSVGGAQLPNAVIGWIIMSVVFAISSNLESFATVSLAVILSLEEQKLDINTIKAVRIVPIDPL